MSLLDHGLVFDYRISYIETRQQIFDRRLHRKIQLELIDV
jgi:hypothetical protein